MGLIKSYRKAIQRTLNQLHRANTLKSAVYLLLPIVLLNPPFLAAETTTLIQPQLSHVSTQQGLSQNTVNSFYQDADGFIWISTLAGLNRYDSSKMLVIEDPDSLFKHQPINSMTSDLNGHYWLSGRNGLVELAKNGEKAQLTQFPADQQNWEQANMILGSESLSLDSIIAFSWNGVYFYSPKGKDISQPQSMQVFHPQSHNLLSYLKSADGYWLGSNQGLYHFDLATKQLNQIKFKNYPSDFKVFDIQSIGKNRIFVAGNKGLYWFDPLSESPFTLSPVTTESISAMTVSNRQLFYAIGDKIYEYDYQGNKSAHLFTLKTTLSEFSEYLITSLFLDNNLQLWIGTHSQGAYIWDSKIPKFETWNANSVDKTHNLDNNIVWSVKLDSQDNYWVATAKGLNYIDAQTGKSELLFNMDSLALNPDNSDIFDLLKIGNSIWLATQYGLIEFNQSTRTATRYLPPEINSKDLFLVYSLTSDDDRTIWLAADSGMLTFNILLKEFTYDRNVMTRFNANQTRHVSFQDGHLWIGAEDKLTAYDLKTQFNKQIFASKRNLNGDYFLITDILVEGNIAWISYAGDGIYGLDFSVSPIKEFARFHTSTGLPDNNVYALEKNGHVLWATTSQGLLKINTRNGQHTLFNHKAGLSSNEFNEGSSVSLKSGELLLGSTRGLIKIDPKQLFSIKPVMAPIVSEALIYSDKNITHLWPVKDHITISENDDLLDLRLTNFDYMGNHTALFEYWFDDKTGDNQVYTTISKLTLTDLAAGSHTLNLRSRSQNRLISSEITKLKITVLPQNRIIPTGQYLLFASIFIIACWLGFRLYSRFRSSKRLLLQTQENEKRLELALIDEQRGIWDCYVDQNNYRQSKIMFYQYQHQPLILSIEDYIALVHPDDIQAARKNWKDFLTGELEALNSNYRCFFLKKWFWGNIKGSINAYHKNGNPSRATGIWTDVDEQENAVNKLTLYRNAFQSTQDIIMILNRELKIVLVNNAYQRTTGFPASQLINMSMIDIALTRFTKSDTDEIRHQLKSNHCWQGQSSVPRKNATSFSVDVKINLIEKNNNETGYVVVMSELIQGKEFERKNIKSTFYDKTTGLPNKTLAFDRLRQQIAICRKQSGSLSLIFLGVDHFNDLKSNLGSDSIGALFSELSARLLPYIQNDDILARYDSDIFLIILKQTEDNASTLHTVNQLLRELSKPISFKGQQINISASAGISNYPSDGENWSELITKGETALAQTREQGSNLFKYYHEGSNKKALERVAMEQKLSRALDENELFLVFQPVNDLASNKIIELDISWRWKTDEDLIIYPSQFLPLVSELGKMREFSDWLIHNALTTLQRWNQEGLNTCISINLTVEYLATKHALKFLKLKVSELKINPKYLLIAISENDPLFSASRLEPVFDEIYSLGLSIVLDDFGKKNASIGNLTALNFHSVKLTNKLIRNVAKSTEQDNLLSSLLSLMNNLNIKTVAKGVENKQQLDFLIQHHCQSAQGYFISDPLNENQARQHLLC